MRDFSCNGALGIAHTAPNAVNVNESSEIAYGGTGQT